MTNFYALLMVGLLIAGALAADQRTATALFFAALTGLLGLGIGEVDHQRRQAKAAQSELSTHPQGAPRE
ncbi:MAG: hypothetical protein KDH15_12140 [Rhodocyclaceae bacterium]|nr:hypothetical protein [Rhodocyclaceae bacterium]